MKIDFSIMLVAILCGCTSFHKDQHVNPFSRLEPSDVSKISLCYEDQIIGPSFYESGEHEIADPTNYVEFYLHPTGVAIRNRETIKKICDSLKDTEFATTNDYPMFGILGYQVFFGKNNEVLETTKIVNYHSTVSIKKCEMKNGRIGFVHDGSIPLNGYSSTYCRLIYEFMKTELPKDIEEKDQFYRSMNKGQTLESLLFNE